MRFLHYKKGEYFKTHLDGVYVRDNGERSQLTLQLYLNEVIIDDTFLNLVRILFSYLYIPSKINGLIVRRLDVCWDILTFVNIAKFCVLPNEYIQCQKNKINTLKNLNDY